MKTFVRKRTADEILALLEKKGWPRIGRRMEEEGSDGIAFRFTVGTISGDAVVSIINGKVIGKLDGGGHFSSDRATFEGLEWFDALLDLAMTNDEPAVAAEKAPHEKTFDEFWTDLVTTDGKMDEEKVKAELHDYHKFMGFAAEVYCHVTGSRISKLNTLPEAVCSVADDVLEERLSERLAQALKDLAEK